MKKATKILILVLISAVLFFGCNSTTGTSKAAIRVDPDNGTFTITPQEFIDGFNSTVIAFQKSSSNAMAKDLILLPDFVESDEDIEMDEGLKVTYVTGGNDKLSKIELMYFTGWPSNEATMTFSFLMSALPAYCNPGTSLDLHDEFNLQSEFDFGETIDGDVQFSFVTVSGGIFIEIEPVQLEEIGGQING